MFFYKFSYVRPTFIISDCVIPENKDIKFSIIIVAFQSGKKNKKYKVFRLSIYVNIFVNDEFTVKYNVPAGSLVSLIWQE